MWIFSIIKFSSVSYFQQFQKCLVFTALTQRDFHLYHYSFLFCLRFWLLILDRFSYFISFLNLNVLSPKFYLIQFVISGYRSFNILFSLHSNPLSLSAFFLPLLLVTIFSHHPCMSRNNFLCELLHFRQPGLSLLRYSPEVDYLDLSYMWFNDAPVKFPSRVARISG